MVGYLKPVWRRRFVFMSFENPADFLRGNHDAGGGIMSHVNLNVGEDYLRHFRKGTQFNS